MLLGVRTALAALFLVACASDAESRAANYPEDQKRIVREMRAELVLPNCTGETDGYKACGMLAYEYNSPAKLRTFVAADCAGDFTESCREKYRLSFEHVIARRYNRAVRDEVDSRCLAEQAERDCTQLFWLESMWLDSHNAHVMSAARQRFETRMDQNNRDQAAIEASRQEQIMIARAIAAAGEGMNSAVQSSSSGRACFNDYGCASNSVCLIPEGQSSGQCFTRR